MIRKPTRSRPGQKGEGRTRAFRGLPPGIRRRFREQVVSSSLLAEEDLARAEAHAERNEMTLPDAVVAQRLAPERDTFAMLAEVSNLPLVEIEDTEIGELVLHLVPERVARQHRIVPLEEDGRHLTYACSKPFDDDMDRDIMFVSGRQPRAVLARPSSISSALDRYYPKAGKLEDLVASLREELRAEPLPDVIDPEASDSPVVRLCHQVLMAAMKAHASDIHFEPDQDTVAVRFRVHGILESVMSLPKLTLNHIANRFKVMARVDISIRNKPQDGAFHLDLDSRALDVRLSTLPTINGEKMVMRIINSASEPLTLKELGYDEASALRYKLALSRPNGLVLLTGPTGCGKTTSLYAALNHLRNGHTNIVSVEDPVERRIEGVNQIPINDKAGTGFAAVLRSVLRQDPNVIMVGEIRDEEVATIVGQAAYTGHLVLSSVHTIDACTAVARLVNLGMEASKVAECLTAIVAQRLIRRVCPECHLPGPGADAAPDVDVPIEDRSPREGPGCARCKETGYVDRVAIAEVLTPHDGVREAILGGATAEELRTAMREAGILTMRENALELVKAGVTTIEEVDRVVSKSAVETAADSNNTTTGTNKILVADDDRMIRMLVKMLLEREGYEIIEAEDGQEAVALAKAENPGLILFDLTMPVMDGYEAIEKMRQISSLASTPMIVLTSETGPGTEKRVLDLGADDYLRKPFEQEVLQARVRGVFRRIAHLTAA
ncbi:MAG: ATPase, T2SS/T4P/T4SS family [Vicinamibacterales bacterium]|nr:ATPase, T2SS/T4P/T4SS family [Vicinamibacterales bacterium]